MRMNVKSAAAPTPPVSHLTPDSVAKVAVVTVTYNSGDVIDDFMRSILAQEHRSVVVYIIDNASTDDTLRRVGEFHDSRIRVIESGGNVGFAAGCNTGMRVALADGCSHVLILNNDTVFGSTLVSGLLRAEADLGADITVPKIYRFDEPNRLWAAGGRFRSLRGYASEHLGEDEIDTGQYETARQVEFAPGCCFLIRSSAIDRLGYFDERYFVYTEDADYCWRAKSLGVKLWYTPSVSLLHKVSSLTGGSGSSFFVRYTTRNRVVFIRKHLPAHTALPWLLALQLLIHWRVLSRREPWVTYRIKQRAFWEGMVLDLS
jgi:GT2 family glycosyltransferase